jgi:hypothetical protein
MCSEASVRDTVEKREEEEEKRRDENEERKDIGRGRANERKEWPKGGKYGQRQINSRDADISNSLSFLSSSLIDWNEVDWNGRGRGNRARVGHSVLQAPLGH